MPTGQKIAQFPSATMAQASIDRITVPVTAVLAALSLIIGGSLSFYVQGMESEQDKIETLIHDNAVTIQGLARNQAVHAEQLQALIRTVQGAVDRGDLHRDRMIRLEAEMEQVQRELERVANKQGQGGSGK